jgi:hypothetical protein
MLAITDHDTAGRLECEQVWKVSLPLEIIGAKNARWEPFDWVIPEGALVSRELGEVLAEIRPRAGFA